MSLDVLIIDDEDITKYKIFMVDYCNVLNAK